MSRALWFLALMLCACGADPAPPNVLLISIDTCRADHCGWLGARTPSGLSPTPHLDALAASASGPREATSCVPLTLPAHTTLMSGLLPDATGVAENDSFVLPPAPARGYSLLAEELRSAGYDTGAFVSGQPLERATGLDAGFRIYEGPESELVAEEELRFRERDCDVTSARAMEWLARRDEAPWFLFVHYFDPHQPWQRRGIGAELPKGAHQDYQSEIMAVDAAIGKVLQALGEARSRTLIIVVSDHGEGLGEHGEETHGHLVHEATLRVPFVMSLPAGKTSARAAFPPARLEDVLPTVRDITRLPPRPSDGVSLLLAQDPSQWRSSAETLYPWFQHRYAPERAFRNATLKLEESAQRAKAFDWVHDPRETRDLLGAQAAEAKMLKEEWSRWRARAKPGKAQERTPEPSAHAPYMGARVPGSGLPLAEEELLLPIVGESFGTLAALEHARGAIRASEPARALALLEPLLASQSGNPALLFWTARAADMAARNVQLAPATRAAFAARALEIYAEHERRFRDPRAADAALRVLLERHSFSGALADLAEVERLAGQRIQQGSAGGLTYALRGRARERAGNADGALADYRSALELMPLDQRLAADVARLKAATTRPR